MKKIFGVFAVMAVLSIAAIGFGCSSSDCDGLADKCADCSDATMKAACDAAAKTLVDADDSDACKAWLDQWETYAKQLGCTK